ELDKKALNTDVIVRKHKDLLTNKVSYSYEVIEKTDKDIEKERENARKAKERNKSKKKKVNQDVNKQTPTLEAKVESEEPAKTTLIKRKVKVWDDNAWGKGRGGNKEIRETLT
uniref:hypothetical protein n=1 Tax=Clostridioides difficile TaxID=1496 RepID=UPI000B171AFC